MSEGDDAATADTIHSFGHAASGDAPDASHVRVSGEPPPPSSEVTLTRYELQDELGRGGMGVVLKARDKQLGRSVALKALHGELASDQGVLKRFLVEAQVCAQLEHPNIVPVYGMEHAAGSPAFSMRLLSGSTLRRYLTECAEQEKAGRVDEEHALPERIEAFLKVCDAIEYAHSRGVIHRDLKPANIVLGEHHEVYLVDWGIAKVVGHEEPDRPEGERRTLEPEEIIAALEAQVSVDLDTATQHGEMIGTPTYMPPEQASGRVHAHGPASDQFALGMMLQELVTLELPRAGRAIDQVFQACRGERVPFERDAVGAPAPPGLAAIVAKATSVEIERRYDSVEALADDVRRWLRGEEVSVLPDPWTRRLFKRLSRRPGLVIGVVAAILVAAAVAATASAFRTVSLQRRAAEQSAHLSRLTSDVVGRSESIDARFSRARTLVEGLGVSIEELAEADAPHEGALRYGVAGRLVGAREPPLAELHEVERYGFEVSWLTPLYLYPPDVAHQDVERTIRVMAPLDRRFREVLLRSLDDEAATWPDHRQREALDEGQTPLHVTYVGFENGLLLNYPGYEPFPESYDPRRRPWYREARDRFGVTFGRPYPDASGSAILVPCNRALRSAGGALIGVAGADMALDDLARAMRVDRDGWIRSSLVDGDGAQIIDTEQAGMRLGIGLHDDAAIEAAPIEPAVLAAIEDEGTGFVRVGDEIVVFDGLEAIDWTFVARFDARRVL